MLPRDSTKTFQCDTSHHHIDHIQAVITPLVQLQPVMLSKFKHGNTYNKFLFAIHCPVGGHQKALGYLAGNQVKSEQFVSKYKRLLPCVSRDIQVFIIYFNTLKPRQDGRHFSDDIFKRIFLNQNVRIPINISLEFVPKGPINNIPALVEIMAWRRPGDKPLSETMLVSLLTHICVTRPQWVNKLCQQTNINGQCVTNVLWYMTLHWLVMTFIDFSVGTGFNYACIFIFPSTIIFN